MVEKKRGRPKGRKTKVVMKIKIGRKTIPVSKTRAEQVRKLQKPTAREEYFAYKFLGLPIPKGVKERAYPKKKKATRKRAKKEFG